MELKVMINTIDSKRCFKILFSKTMLKDKLTFYLHIMIPLKNRELRLGYFYILLHTNLIFLGEAEYLYGRIWNSLK